MRLFEDAVLEGNLASDSAELYAYGIYLMHGGNPENFKQFTMDDIQILITAYTGTMARQNKQLFKMLKAMAGATDD